MTLTRADLETGRLQQLIAQSGINIHVLTEAELQASLDHTLQQCPQTDIWLFAYGSLIWNPIFHFVERRVGTVHGFHRRFCLWTALGRGTPDNPGLMLGLDRGGSCRGILYRVAPEVRSELLLVWRREMVVGSYIPRWVKVIEGDTVRLAIAFIINRSHPFYASKLSLEATVQHLATARGPLGSCADYLQQTVEGLMQSGIRDRRLHQLQRQVMALQKHAKL
ncbi:MAG: gamma-glutamylcyclotransferase [Synechococcales cyanobacterium M58_A2018_015]|nr:gamma-glutamylcyclotransferase [Synechococcales cyanobacterium M58_A2018_015]